MKQPLKIIIEGSTWGDVFVAGFGSIGCVYDLGLDVFVDFYVVENDTLVKNNGLRFPFNEGILFARGDRNELGHVLVMGQGAKSGRFLIQSSAGNYAPDNPLTTYGTHVCDLEPTATGFTYVVQVSQTHYYDSMTKRLHELPPTIHGTSQGLIQLIHGDIQWSDIWRTEVQGMLYPFLSDNIYVGEGRTDPAHIQAQEAGIQKNILNAVAERPRACYFANFNLFATVSRSGAGVEFNFFNRPLPNLDIVNNDPIPDPEVPEIPNPEPLMRLPTQVIDTLDRFFAKYPLRVGEDNIRQLVISACEQVAYEYPGQRYGTKRADPGRPVSKDAIAQKVGDKLFAWDMVHGAGTNNPKLVYETAEAMNVSEQVFIGPGDELDNDERFHPHDHIGTLPIPDEPDMPNDDSDAPTGYIPTPTSDAELERLSTLLDAKYVATRLEGGLGRGPTTTYVDPLGRARWMRDYFIHRDTGSNPDEAWKKINRTINDIVGIPGDLDPNG